ncbi:uncharacterized protein LOC115279771 [Suricata suricatta]|uniref:uncharacterized protein LOC115279771 n=1 Tax=Suricata suricatta TaxID=37032 RepID=UPI001155A3BF|nr:uncharacterized protein LOC115279771 [Suricata suricatta]
MQIHAVTVKAPQKDSNTITLLSQSIPVCGLKRHTAKSQDLAVTTPKRLDSQEKLPVLVYWGKLKNPTHSVTTELSQDHSVTVSDTLRHRRLCTASPTSSIVYQSAHSRVRHTLTRMRARALILHDEVTHNNARNHRGARFTQHPDKAFGSTCLTRARGELRPSTPRAPPATRPGSPQLTGRIREPRRHRKWNQGRSPFVALGPVGNVLQCQKANVLVPERSREHNRREARATPLRRLEVRGAQIVLGGWRPAVLQTRKSRDGFVGARGLCVNLSPSLASNRKPAQGRRVTGSGSLPGAGQGGKRKAPEAGVSRREPEAPTRERRGDQRESRIRRISSPTPPFLDGIMDDLITSDLVSQGKVSEILLITKYSSPTPPFLDGIMDDLITSDLVSQESKRVKVLSCKSSRHASETETRLTQKLLARASPHKSGQQTRQSLGLIGTDKTPPGPDRDNITWTEIRPAATSHYARYICPSLSLTHIVCKSQPSSALQSNLGHH